MARLLQAENTAEGGLVDGVVEVADLVHSLGNGPAPRAPAGGAACVAGIASIATGLDVRFVIHLASVAWRWRGLVCYS